MTKPLPSSVTRQLLRRAVALLDGYEDYPLHEQWTEARHAFLTELTASLDVGSTRAAVEALTPKPKYRNHKAERAIRYAAIVAAYQKDGATLASVAKEFGMGITGVHRIYHEWRRKTEKGIDPSSASVPVSPLSLLDSRPPTSPSASSADVEPIERTDTDSARSFQPSAP